MTPLDETWLHDHPLPQVDYGTDKNSRGRLLIAGSSELVPGALLLSGEAAFRAGAGKVQLALPASVATSVGVRIPEAAVFGLETNDEGELGPAPDHLTDLLGRCDALVLGPGMGSGANAHGFLEAVLAHSDSGVALLLDAAAIGASPDFEDELRAWQGPLVLTPHPGEMAALMHCEGDEVHPDMAAEAADRFKATVLLKGPRTVVASPDKPMLQYRGGGPGLATGGSGDVLAGVIGGLLARGADARTAAAWGVWTHGEAGRRTASRVAQVGFLSRELLGEVPDLIYGGGSPSDP
jgi:ADP-dependent NAD(P)H-hydrate dehydratase